LLTRSALPVLRASDATMIVNVASGIAQFGEALRRELKGGGLHVLTVYPGGTDTLMMRPDRAGPEFGFSREAVSAIADAIGDSIEADASEPILGGEVRAQMIALNPENPSAA
jgi:short-subunit dehydrogenase